MSLAVYCLGMLKCKFFLVVPNISVPMDHPASRAFFNSTKKGSAEIMCSLQANLVLLFHSVHICRVLGV